MTSSNRHFAAVAATLVLLLASPVLGRSQSMTQAVTGSLDWRLVGPFRGGWATMVAGVPAEPDTFYFAAAGGGLWRSVNAGRTWVSLFDHGPAASVGALAIAPSDPKTIYLGTGQPEPRYDIASGEGVFKSNDGGRSWTSLGLADTRYIGALWVDPRNPRLVVVGAQGHFFGPSAARGIYRSADGGKTWSHPLAINAWTGVVDLAGDPADSRVLFASAWEAHQYPWQSYFTPVTGAGSAIYKSMDEGLSWKRLAGNGWPSGALGRIGIAVTRTATGTRVYAAIDSKSDGGLYRSDDGGAHWARVNKEDAFTSWYASRLTVAPNDPDIVYTVGQSIRRCTKGGASCEIFKGAPGGDDYHHVWINPLHPDHMITGSDQGTVASVDGGATWSSWYNQPTGQFYHLAADNRFPYWIYSGQQDSGTVGIASRSDYGAIGSRDWHPVGGDERDYDIPDPADPSIVYGSGLGGRVSLWDGKTGQVQNIAPWPESSYGKRPTLVRYHYLWMTPLEPSRTGPFALYLGAQVLFRSQDRGRHWTAISGDLTGPEKNAHNCNAEAPTLRDARACGYGSISAIAPSPLSAADIWVGTDDGLIQHTRDSGAHWDDVTPHGIAMWAKVAAIDVSAVKPDVAYAAIDGHRIDDFAPHVLRTHDGGASWQTIDTGLPPDHFVDVVRADPVRAGLLYAGTDAGVYVSLDDGDHWMPLGQNLPTAWVTDLLVHGGDLIAATEGRAIWTMDDIAPLRDTAQAGDAAHLFAPSDTYRMRANNYLDTPPPPEEPASANPPEGAAIDYWIGSTPAGPVTLDIRDSKGELVRHFATDVPETVPKAERYFAAGWVRPPQQLSAAPGFHRFMWNLRYARPPAIAYDYSIAAVWGRPTPVKPEGLLVLPGNYRIVLKVNGRAYNATLRVVEDPRVRTSSADLGAELAFSRRIAAVSAVVCKGHEEKAWVDKQLDTLIPESRSHDRDDDTHPGKSGAPADPLRALADRLRAKAAPGEPAFEAVDAILAATESDLETVDAAPTQAQIQSVDDATKKLTVAQRNWDALKSGPLAALNAALRQRGKKPVTMPPANAQGDGETDGGQDLP
ncbi:MAG TPA: hypothetical protein VGF97_07455 [Rhizomicrobium sp.]